MHEPFTLVEISEVSPYLSSQYKRLRPCCVPLWHEGNVAGRFRLYGSASSQSCTADRCRVGEAKRNPPDAIALRAVGCTHATTTTGRFRLLETHSENGSDGNARSIINSRKSGRLRIGSNADSIWIAFVFR